MTKPIKLTKDRQGESFYPATTTDAVVDRKRVKALSEILDDIDEAIQNGVGLTEIPDNSITTAKMVDKAVTMAKLSDDVQEVISEVAAKANTAQSTASSAVASAQSASITAGNAVVYAQSLTERLEQAEQTANNASATATSANNVAVAASAEVANLRTQLNNKVGSTTITAMELITQSDYDTKKALGEISDTTAYLITDLP